MKPVKTFVRLVPLRMPGEIRGIHIGGEALAKTVQLIRTDKVHLSGKTGSVTQMLQVVREGRDLGGKLGGVIPGADLARQAAAHHDET